MYPDGFSDYSADANGTPKPFFSPIIWLIMGAMVIFCIVCAIIKKQKQNNNVNEQKNKGDYNNMSEIQNSYSSESYFDGGLLQQIGWTLLGSILSAITLGLGVPWAVCFIESWKAKHTVIEGRRLAFDGTGLQLFGNYIKWFLLTIITLGIYGLWLGIKMRKWIVKHTHFAR